MKPSKKLKLSLQTVRVLTTHERSATEDARAQPQQAQLALPTSPVCSIFTSCYKDCP
jgi:hypothetical protein